MKLFIVGVCLGLGLFFWLRGMFPARPTLADRLARYAEVEARPTSQQQLRTAWGRVGVWTLRRLRGDLIAEVEADVAVADGDLERHATDKLNAGVGGAGLLTAGAYALGHARSLLVVGLLVIIGFAVGYFLPDIDLKKKSKARRAEFTEALTAFVSLVGVSIAGGGGVNSAMADATSIGSGWCFEALRRSIEDSALQGESPWAGFDELGRRFNLVPLIELAGALSLAGNSGARVTETLQARAESGRAKELNEATTTAEKKSESMNIPVAGMMIGWMIFMGYPAIANLLGA